MADEAKTPEQETESYEVFVTEAVGDQSDTQETESEGSANTQEVESQEGKEVSTDEADSKTAADAGEAPKKGKARNSYQKRIDRLTKRAKEAEDELASIKGKGKEPEADDSRISDDNTDEPDPSDFDSYDQYLDSLADWKAGTRKKEKADNGKDKGTDDKDQSQNEDTEYTEALEDVQDAFEESRGKYDDFDDVVTAEDVQITKDMVKALAESDNPGDVAYYLGKHKDEASRIAGLSPLAQAREIGKLEAKVANIKPPGKKTTQAPDPIEPVRGSNSAVKSPENMDFSEYESTMNERERSGKGFW